MIVTAGLAEIAAGAIAMGLGGYLAARTAQHFVSELSREGWEVENKREFELNQVREVFTEYGLTGTHLKAW